MNLDTHSRHQRALKLIRVDEQSHRLDSQSVAGSASHCENRGILDHVGGALWIRDIDLKPWMIDLNEWWQADLIVTLLRLVEPESVIDRRHRRNHMQRLRH